jgi:hypothetical protein
MLKLDCANDNDVFLRGSGDYSPSNSASRLVFTAVFFSFFNVLSPYRQLHLFIRLAKKSRGSV